MKKIAASLLVVFALSFAPSKTANAQTYVPPYGQCGGAGYTGPTLCVPGYACIVINYWFSQCLIYP